MNADVIRQVWRPTIVTYVETHPDKIARRGFDHMAEIVNYRRDIRRFEIRPILRQVNPAEMPPNGRRINPDDFALLDGVGRNLRIDPVPVDGRIAWIPNCAIKLGTTRKKRRLS